MFGRRKRDKTEPEAELRAEPVKPVKRKSKRKANRKEQQRRREAGERPCRTPKFLGLDHEDWFFSINAASDTVVDPVSKRCITKLENTNITG